jgi:uncharacterized membrane protein
MEPDQIIAFISRLVHVGTAIVLVGGTTVLRFVVIPSLAGQPPEIAQAIRGRWKMFVHIGIGLFLISGLYNYMIAIPSHKGDGLYHAMLGIKMMLAFGVFFLASVLVGRSKGTQKFRDEHTKWMTILLLIAFTIISISSFVKIRGVPSPAADDEPDAAESESA